jgi:hypothetical protein
MVNLFEHIGFLRKKLLTTAVIFLVVQTVLSQESYSDSTIYSDTTVVVEEEYLDSDVGPTFDSLNLSEIPSFNTYAIEDSVIKNLKNDKAFWYVDRTPKRQKPAQAETDKTYAEPFYLQNWFRTLLWIIIVGAFIAVLVWFLIASDIKLFRKKAKTFQSPDDINISEDIFSINYEEELQKAIVDQNYRLGVRLMYLHVLRLLSEKNIIEYKIERTNSDYLLQLFNTSYYKDFFRLTRNFEYVWYGKFDISPAAFEIIRQDHSKIKGRL